MDEERPVHTVVDCSSGEVTHIPLSDEEWAEHRQRSAEHAAAVQAEAARRDELAARVAAHSDPLVQLLAQKAGLA